MLFRFPAPGVSRKPRFFGIEAIAVVAWLLPGSSALGQGTSFVKEVISREFTVDVGGVQDPQYEGVREVHSREISLYIENGPAPSKAEAISREFSLLVTSDEIPPAITGLDVTVSPTGEIAYLDWSSYNQWAVGDIAGFRIYVTSTGPFSNVDDLSGDPNAQMFVVPGETTNFEINGLTPFTDHYFAVVPFDGQSGVNSSPLVNYAASYVLSPEVISREVGIYVGGEPDPPYQEVVSREVSLSVVSDEAPPAISDFSVTSSPTGDAATLNWSGYNQWAVGDIDHFKIYVTASGPFSDVDAISDPNLRVIDVPGGQTQFEVTGLTPFTDHYFAIVAVDGLGNYESGVNYGASYVLSSEVLSREFSLFIGGDRPDPFQEVISREYSILVPDQSVPAPVTGIDSGFSVTTSNDEFGAVRLDWSSYPEEAQLDVVRYRVYVAGAFFDDVTGLTPVAYFPAGQQIRTLAGLGGSQVLHFAVVAEDALGNFNPVVRSFSEITSVDGVGEVGNLSVISGADSLDFSWTAPETGAEFLAGYRVYFADNASPVELGNDATAWSATGLGAGTGYPFRITTVDSFGKESAGRTVVGATLLSNPGSLTLVPDGTAVSLQWGAAQPSALVSHYQIFRSASPITDVSGLTPIATRTSNEFSFGDFASAVGNHYAVAVVNLSGGRIDSVTSIPGISDSDAPEILSVSLGGNVIASGAALGVGGVLSAEVTDDWGVARVEFALLESGGGKTVLGSDTISSDGFTSLLDLEAIADGNYDLEVKALDVFGNEGLSLTPITIALAPPPAPVITSPESPLSTQSASLAFFGTAPPFSDVYLYEDGIEVAGPLQPNQNFVFATSLPVSFGESVFTARARNRSGESTDSNAVTIAKRPPLTLSLDLPAVEEGSSITGTVSTSQNVSTDLFVSLSSNRPSQLSLAGAVVIPAGSQSAPFEFVAVQDELIEPTYSATISASAAGAIGDEISVVVGDDDWPVLQLTMNATTISEGVGPGELVGHISRSPVTSEQLFVTLLSSDESEIESVEFEIPAGVASINVPVPLIDDEDTDGAQTVSLTAELAIGSEFESSNTVEIEVTDDEGPILELSSVVDLLREGEDLTLVVKRAGAADLDGDLEVVLTSEDPLRMVVPATVTIPDGEEKIGFLVSSPDNGIEDGSERLTVTASATTYASALRKLLVTDEALPELTPSGLQVPESVVTDEYFDLSYSLQNAGPVEIPAGFTQRVYLSDDPVAGNDTLVDQESFPAGEPAADAVLEIDSRVRAPSGRGEYWIVVETDFGNAVAEINEDNNFLISRTPLRVDPAYEITFSVDGDTFPANTPIPMSGSATQPDGYPAKNATVAIYLRKGPTERQMLALTGEDGTFSTQWQALPGEGGLFSAGAAHPGDDPATVASTESFEILTIEPEFSETETQFNEGDATVISGTIFNPGTIALTGLQLVVGDLPEGLEVVATLEGGLTALGAGQSAVVQLDVSADEGTHGRFEIEIEVVTNEGVTIPVVVPVAVRPLLPLLVIEPSSLDCSILRGGQKTGSFQIRNDGGTDSGDLSVLMPGISWLSAVSPTELPSIAPGESVDFSFLLQPGDEVPLTLFSGNFVVRAANAPADTTVPFSFRTVSDGKGDFEIEVVDEFFFFSEQKPKVEGARIVVRDVVSGVELDSVVTDSTGVHLFEDLMEGWYQVEVHSPDHTNVKGNYFVNAGEVNERQIFVSRELVKYTWTVEEIEIEDRYRVTVDTTFETNVPAPVVTVSPAVLELGDLTQVGQQKVVNFTIENHGLIAAQDTEISFGDHPYYKIIPLIEKFGTIAAKTSITVPVEIRRVGAVANGANSLAGPSQSPPFEIEVVPCSIPAGVTYAYYCADDKVVRGSPIVTSGIEGNCLGFTPTPKIPDGPGGERREVSVVEVRYETSDPNCLNLCLFESLLDMLIKLLPDPSGCALGAANAYNTGNALDVLTPIFDCGCLLVDSIPHPGTKVAAKAACETKAGADFAICIKKLVECLIEVASSASTRGMDIDSYVSSEEGMRELLTAIQIALTASQSNGGASVDATTPISAEDIATISNFDSELGDAVQRIVRILEYQAYRHGSLAAYDASVSVDYRDWNTMFYLFSFEESDGAESITADEIADLAPLTDGLDTAICDLRVERWNNTVALLKQGIVNRIDAPVELRDRFVASDVLKERAGAMLEAIGESVQLGHNSPANEFKSRLKMILESLNRGEGGVCSKVRINLDQDVVMTRSAFRATLELQNLQSDAALTNVSLDLDIRDSAGSPAAEHFNVRVSHLDGFESIDGTSGLAANSLGIAQWTLIPRNTAAPQLDTIYTVGGTIRYGLNGTTLSIPVADVPITVRPDAALTLKYFHQRDVIADDPHTDPIEAAIPYALAVMAKNDGAGSANNLRIVSGQPEIVENEKGLLIDFSILSSQVEGEPASPSLAVDLGDVAAGETKIATWLLRSTVQGLFTEYEATFEHIDGLGDPKISLLKDVEIHETIRVFQALGDDHDGRPDFLVNDVPDPDDAPDTVHLSDGSTEAVVVIDAAPVAGTLEGSNPVLTIDAGARSGWTYLRIPDPGDGEWTLDRVVRSDGRELPMPADISVEEGGFSGLGNAWVTDRTFVGLGRRPVRENVLHLIDSDTTGSYQLHYSPYVAPVDTTSPSSEVEMLPDESGSLFQVSWSGSDNVALAHFDIYVSVDGGDWELWMESTTLRSATFLGDPNREYAFYSIATDTAGNSETPPGVADATTVSALTNNPPLIDPLSNLTVTEGDRVSVPVLASDPDGNDAALVYRVLSPEPGLVMDQETGLLTWTTGETDGGKAVDATVRVSDSGFPASFSEETIRIEVIEENSAPVLDPVSSTTVAPGGLFLVTARAEDRDFPDQPITFALESGPQGMTVDPNNGLISWLPTVYDADQSYTITVSASDGAVMNGTSSTSFSVSVGAAADITPTDLQSWALSKGITEERIFESQDDEGDGSHLLLEYAFELDPNFADNRIHDPATPSAGLPKVSLQSGKLVIEYMRRVTDPNLRYFAEFGSELATGEVTFDSSGVTTSVVAVGTDWERVTVEDDVSTGEASRRFGRIRVSLAED